MCGHCGCHEVDAVAELVREHDALVEQSAAVSAALARGDRAAARTLLSALVGHLGTHVEREEHGLFAALREQGDFAGEVQALEGEHRDLDHAVGHLDTEDPGFEAAVRELLADLAVHIEREDVGVFPVSVVTLGASGWDTVARAHAATPSFLPGVTA